MVIRNGLWQHMEICGLVHRYHGALPRRSRAVPKKDKQPLAFGKTAGDAGDDLNESGFPLGSLFVTGGVVFIVVAAAILMGVLKKAR